MTKISVNKSEFDQVVRNISLNGNDLVSVRNGLQKREGVNVSTADEMISFYAKITKLVSKYGTLINKDSERFERVAQHMKEYDEKVGRLK